MLASAISNRGIDHLRERDQARLRRQALTGLERTGTPAVRIFIPTVDARAERVVEAAVSSLNSGAPVSAGHYDVIGHFGRSVQVLWADDPWYQRLLESRLAEAVSDNAWVYDSVTNSWASPRVQALKPKPKSEVVELGDPGVRGAAFHYARRWMEQQLSQTRRGLDSLEIAADDLDRRLRKASGLDGKSEERDRLALLAKQSALAELSRFWMEQLRDADPMRELVRSLVITAKAVHSITTNDTAPLDWAFDPRMPMVEAEVPGSSARPLTLLEELVIVLLLLGVAEDRDWSQGLICAEVAHAITKRAVRDHFGTTSAWYASRLALEQGILRTFASGRSLEAADLLDRLAKQIERLCMMDRLPLTPRYRRLFLTSLLDPHGLTLPDRDALIALKSNLREEFGDQFEFLHGTGYAQTLLSLIDQGFLDFLEANATSIVPLEWRPYPEGFALLNERQRILAGLLAAGLSNQEIVDVMIESESSVKNGLTRVCRRLRIPVSEGGEDARAQRVEMMRRTIQAAREQGLIEKASTA